MGHILKVAVGVGLQHAAQLSLKNGGTLEAGRVVKECGLLGSAPCGLRCVTFRNSLCRHGVSDTQQASASFRE